MKSGLLGNMYFCGSIKKNMKKISLVVLLLTVLQGLNAQTGKPAAKPAAAFKNNTDSASYAVGISVASFYKQQGMTTLNAAIVAKAINDGLSGKKPVLDDATCNKAIMTYQTRMQEQKSKPKIEEGKKFLVMNKNRPGVKTTASGLQYEVITEGKGERVKPQDTVTVHYRGTYINGTGFDNSYDRGQPYTTDLFHVIAGWTEGLQLMTAGSKYKFYVPYTLGYGPADYNGIPGGSLLIFEVDLLSIKGR
jgi:FKBP-type peptidyl-prolyl cis-trans isomerase